MENVTPTYVTERYDVITSQLALEAASRNLEEYRKFARNVTGILKQGGHLFVAGVFNTSTSALLMCPIGEKIYTTLSYTEEFLREEYAILGFTDIKIKAQKVTDLEYLKIVPCTHLFVFHAIKGKN